MERIAVFFRLKPGKEKLYKKRHDEIWPEMHSLLSEAGIWNYSIWRKEGMLFGYYETEDNAKTEQALQASPVYEKWRREMEEYVDIEEKTGQKEWPMELMFLHE